MLETILKFVNSPAKIITILLLILGIIILTKFQSCGLPLNNTTTVTDLKVTTPTNEDKNLVGPDKKAVGRLDIKNQKERPTKWLDKKTHIVIAEDSKCNTCPTTYVQVDKTKTFLGWDFEPKIALTYAPYGLGLTYDQGIFRYGKFTIDALISFPGIGLGLGFNLTNNTFILAGAQWQYGKYKSMTDFDTYAIILPEYKIVPVIGVGFGF